MLRCHRKTGLLPAEREKALPASSNFSPELADFCQCLKVVICPELWGKHSSSAAGCLEEGHVCLNRLKYECVLTGWKEQLIVCARGVMWKCISCVMCVSWQQH